MFSLLLLWIGALIRLFRSRGNLVLENLMLRQQLAVLKRRHRRPSIGPLDKLFWVAVRRLLRCYISRVENGHTVPAIETLEKLARAMEMPLYQLMYDGQKPPALPPNADGKRSD